MKNTITSWLFKAFGILTAISLLLGLPATIPAADFPSKPAKIIVAFPQIGRAHV